MLTEPLTGARKPEQTDGPLGGLQISNLADDLAPFEIPYFATASARDTAFADWVSAGHAMRDGLHCYVESLGDQVYVNSGWQPLTGSLVAHAESSASTGIPGTAETRLTGPQNLGAVTLLAGYAYEVIARGDIQSAGPTAGSILGVNLRAAKGTTPTTTSTIVAGMQTYAVTPGAAGEVSWTAAGEFQVANGGSDWQIHFFGRVLSVATAMTVTPDARGVISISVYNRGLVTPGMRSI